MRRQMGRLTLVLGSFVLLTTAGCAKKQVVAPDDQAAQQQQQQAQQQAAKPTPADQQKQQQPVKEEPVQEQVVRQAPAPKEEQAPAIEQTTPETVLQTVYFDFDSFVLSPAARTTLAKNGEYLKKNAAIKVQLEGHTDERGADDYNLSLGEKRAKAAQSYLSTLGIQANRLSIISYGEEKPADQGHDEAAWARNRRVEFIIVK